MERRELAYILYSIDQETKAEIMDQQRRGTISNGTSMKRISRFIHRREAGDGRGGHEPLEVQMQQSYV